MVDVYAYRAREKAKRRLQELVDDGRNLFIAHYNCESLKKQDGKSPRIASISVRNFAVEESKAFSLHMVRERLFPHIDPEDLSSDNLDAMERTLLDEFFQYLAQIREANWIHWKMNSENFGFAAIEHRAKVLGVLNVVQIPFRHRRDLSLIIESIYGKGYTASHPHWKILTEKNDITATDAVWNLKDNPAEVELFTQKEFRLLQNSAIQKTSILRQLVSLTASGQLKTDGNLEDILASRFLSWFDRARSNPWFSLATFLFSVIGFFATILKLLSFLV